MVINSSSYIYADISVWKCWQGLSSQGTGEALQPERTLVNEQWMNYGLPVCPNECRSEAPLCSCCLCRASFQSMTLWLKETLSPLCLRCLTMSWRRTRTRSKLSVWSKPKNPWSVQCIPIFISSSFVTICFFSTFTESVLIGVVVPGVVGILQSHALVLSNPFRKG